MKWLQGLLALAVLVLFALSYMFFLKIAALDEALEHAVRKEDLDTRLRSLEQERFAFKSEVYKSLGAVLDRIDALESGTADKAPKGPVTLEFLVNELERQIHLKKDAALVPDEERKAQEKMDRILGRLEEMEGKGEDVAGVLVERVRVNRDPDVQIVLIRDVLWRLGPEAAPGLVELFRDEKTPPNLRVLAAASAVRVAPDRRALLAELARHLADPKEALVVKTGLVRLVFREHRFEGAVEALVQGAMTQGFPDTHRVECLRALSVYDDPRVIRALEEIMGREKESGFLKNLAIDAYHRLLDEECVPFLRKLLEQDVLDPVNKEKVRSVLKQYEGPGTGGGEKKGGE